MLVSLVWFALIPALRGPRKSSLLKDAWLAWGRPDTTGLNRA